jgi:hypothetical protein
MGGLVVGLAGAVAGSVIGQPALGYAVGSALGGMFFGGRGQIDSSNITQVGPRINDLNVQSSAYGAVIPIVYGLNRLAGNLIWSTNLAETQHVTTSTSGGGGGGGGKGGGGGGGGGVSITQTTITYTYSVSSAVGFCLGPVSGIRRIWADSKLIYDASNPQFASPPWLAIYLGTQTQGVNSLIAGYVGGANAPAFRGLCYCVFNNFQLADFGNHIPNFTAEIINTTTANVSVITLPYNGYNVSQCQNKMLVNVTNNFTNSLLIDVNNLNSVVNTGFGAPSSYSAMAFNGLGYFSQANNTVLYKFDLGSGTTIQGVQLGAIGPGNLVFDGISNRIGIAIQGSGGTDQVRTYDVNLRLLGTFHAAANSRPGSLSLKPGVSLFAGTTNSNPVIIYGINILTMAQLWAVAPRASGGSVVILYIDQLDLVAVLYTNAIYFLNPNNGATISSYAVTGYTMVYDKGRNLIWFLSGTSLSYMNIFNLGAITNVSSYLIPTYATSFRDFNIDFNGRLWITTDNNKILITEFFLGVGGILADLCSKSGLTSDQYDASLVNTTCRGYVLPNITTARDAITPLSQAFFFDAVESDGQIKFVPRGGNHIATLDWNNDLAAYPEGQQLPDILTVTRAQELDLPRKIYFKYYNYNADYQQGSQYASRLITQAVNEPAFTVAVVFTDQEAAQVVDIMLSEAWWNRETYEFFMTQKYAYIDPCDVIIVNLQDGEQIRMRLTEVDFTLPGLIHCKATHDRQEIYTSIVEGAPVIFTPIYPTISSQTQLVLLDIPILRDQDDSCGFYAVCCGLNPAAWRGTVVYISTDSGNTYTQVFNTVVSGTIGYAITALGGWTDTNTWDYSNTLTVVMTSGELQSVTEQDIYNGLNAAVLGNEIIQFRDAELIDINTYKLSYLLRGRRGTEQWMNSHIIGDSFSVVTNTTGFFIPQPTSLLNVPELYSAVSVGSSLQYTPDEIFTNTGASLKPYSVVNPHGVRDTSHNLTIFWTRRGRIANDWRDNADIPLGEQSEKYEIDIYNGAFNTVLRTITVNNQQSVVYTAAQQVTDFASTQSSINMMIYQISATVGRGFPRSATL